jgi:hypothetical protein
VGSTLQQLRRQYGSQAAFVFQDFGRYLATAASNVGFGAVEHRADHDHMNRVRLPSREIMRP